MLLQSGNDTMVAAVPGRNVVEIIREHASLLDVPSHAVIATTTAGEVVYWNVGAARLYGWHEAEVMGRNIVEVTPSAQTRHQAEEIMRTLRDGQPWTGEFGVRTREGREFRVQVRDLPVRDGTGDLIGIIGVSNPV